MSRKMPQGYAVPNCYCRRKTSLHKESRFNEDPSTHAYTCNNLMGKCKYTKPKIEWQEEWTTKNPAAFPAPSPTVIRHLNKETTAQFFKQEEHINIATGTLSIGRGAFFFHEHAVSVTVPATVCDIGVKAFAQCPLLRKVVIHADVSTLPQGVFANCPKLQSVTLNENISTIDSRAFFKCKQLCNLPLVEGLEHIGARAFQGTSAAVVAPPSTLETVSKSAFDTRSLRSIHGLKKSKVDVKSKAEIYGAVLTSLGSGKQQGPCITAWVATMAVHRKHVTEKFPYLPGEIWNIIFTFYGR